MMLHDGATTKDCQALLHTAVRTGVQALETLGRAQPAERVTHHRLALGLVAGEELAHVRDGRLLADAHALENALLVEVRLLALAGDLEEVRGALGGLPALSGGPGV